jgi:hypothetical protein
VCRICQSKEEKAEHRKLSHQYELNQAQTQELETSKQTGEVRESEYQRDFVQNVPAQRRGDGRTKEEQATQTAASGQKSRGEMSTATYPSCEQTKEPRETTFSENSKLTDHD